MSTSTHTESRALPREMMLWLQSLNLTYKIVNPKRDLANGWIFAQILSRYPEYQELEMYQIDNGMSLSKRRENWIFLQKFFKKHEIPISEDDYDQVIHQAPNAAYNLLKKFYMILNKDAREL
jgi:hypothetical protein